MKNIKIFLWIVLIVLVTLVFFQNKVFFTTGQELTLDLYVADAFHAELPIAVWFLAILILGFLVAYFLGLLERFKAKRVIKELNAQIATQREMLTQLRTELESSAGLTPEKGSGTPVETAAPTEMGPPTV